MGYLKRDYLQNFKLIKNINLEQKISSYNFVSLKYQNLQLFF